MSPQFPACAAAVDAGIGAGIDLAAQLLSSGVNLQCVDKGSVALFAGIGTIPF